MARVLEEFKEITDNEAAKTYLSKMPNQEMRHEIEIVASRPRLDPVAWQELRNEVREISNGDLDHIQGHFCDPFSEGG